MWSTIIIWLSQPANQGLVTTLVSVFTLALSVFTYLKPRAPARKNGNAARQNRSVQDNTRRRRTYSAIVGVLALLGVAWGLYIWLIPTVKVFTICTGEFERECGRP